MPRLNGFKIIIIYTLLVFVTLCFVCQRIFRRVRTFIIYTRIIFEFGRRVFRNVQSCRRCLLRFIYAIPVFVGNRARVGRKQYQTIIIRPCPCTGLSGRPEDMCTDFNRLFVGRPSFVHRWFCVDRDDPGIGTQRNFFFFLLGMGRL